MAKRVRDALLKAELIIPIGDRVIGSGAFAVRISQYEMPIPIHMQWCSALAATDEEMAALGSGLEGLV